jgi:hypothetical protein
MLTLKSLARSRVFGGAGGVGNHDVANTRGFDHVDADECSPKGKKCRWKTSRKDASAEKKPRRLDQGEERNEKGISMSVVDSRSVEG